MTDFDNRTNDALRLLDRLRPAVEAHDRAATVAIIARLVELQPQMGKQWLQIARLASQDGEVTLARRAADCFVRDSDESDHSRYEKAGLLADIGVWAEAHELLQSIATDVPSSGAYAHSRGTAALYAGEVDESREWLERAIDLLPRSGVTWQSLATLVNFSQDDALARRVIGHEKAMQNAAPSDRGLYYHALGKVHADRGDHARAFDAFSRGAGLVRQTIQYSRERDQRIAQGAMEGFDKASIAAIASRQSEDTSRTIFVTGMPRSGTTLLEQILSSHSGVSDGGETNRLGLFVKDIQGLSQDALAKHLERSSAPKMARLWDHWMRECFPAQGRVVDSTNNSSRMIGLAAALLPDAPIVWMVRDPLDCAWSCLRTYFLSGNGWSYDQQDIAWHLKLEEQLRAHWIQVLGERLLLVPYEEMVSDPATWIPRILSHCDLAMEEQTLRPHEARRVAATSSVIQVRQPINRKAIGSAQPYAQFLSPFQQAYFG